MHVDNRIRGWKNGQDLFTVTANGAPPPNVSRYAFTSFDSAPGNLTYLQTGGYNEPRAPNAHNEWGFRWRLSRINERGVEVWSEVFQVRCDQDQAGGWDQQVYFWTLTIRWTNKGISELDAEDARKLEELYPRKL